MSVSSDSASSSQIVIAIVGMAGSGKSEAAKFFKEKNIPILRLGDVIDEGIKAEGLSWTPENNVYYRSKIRKELGMAAVAIKMLPKIQEIFKDNKYIVIDGLYSWEEYVYLQRFLSNIFLLCIYTRPSIRYNRLENRATRAFSKEDALRRDITEIEETHKAGPIAVANYLVKNETTIENFQEKLNIFWQNIEKGDIW